MTSKLNKCNDNFGCVIKDYNNICLKCGHDYSTPEVKEDCLEISKQAEWEERLTIDFLKEFNVDGVTFKGARHWKDGVKHNLIINWWLNRIKEVRAEAVEEYKQRVEVVNKKR